MRAGGRAVSALLLLSTSLAACSSPGGGEPTVDSAVQDFVRRSQGSTGGGYVSPDIDALREIPVAVLAAADGRTDVARSLLEPHAYRLADVRGAHLVLPVEVPDGRGWGLYAVRPRGRPLAVEVPHPRADRRTEHLGAALAREAGAQHLLVAGARRDRAGGDADVAHREQSLFSAVHAALAAQGVPAVQVHGYAQESSPGNDVVVSPGAAGLTRLARRIASGLSDSGFRTCRTWRDECGALEGRTNTQSRASADAGAAFVHLEVAAPVREDRERRAALVAAVATAVRGVVPLRRSAHDRSEPPDGS